MKIFFVPNREEMRGNMENKKSVIMVPFHDYKKWLKEGFRTRDAHLFEHFKVNPEIEQILVVNRPVSIAEMLLKRMSWKTKVGKKITGGKHWILTQIDEKSYCIDFFVPEFWKVAKQRKNWWNTVFEKPEILEAIREAIQFLNMKNTVLLLQNPMAVGVVHNLGEDAFIFDAIDNWLYHPQMQQNRETVEKNYDFIMKEADAIFTVSESLKEFFQKGNKRVYWIANGVDKEYFRESWITDTEKRKNATIGYIGKIQDRVDFDLIEECLKKYQEHTFFIAGPIYSQKDRVKQIKEKYTNIRFLGDIHYRDLPKAVKEMDITIVPHKVDAFTNSMNPLKIYEYLASGKQIVTTPVAGIESFHDYVYEASSKEEFIVAIKRAIEIYEKTENIAEKVAETLEDKHLWEAKVDEMIKIMQEI